jgi:hypothetical protein
VCSAGHPVPANLQRFGFEANSSASDRKKLAKKVKRLVREGDFLSHARSGSAKRRAASASAWNARARAGNRFGLFAFPVADFRN